MAVPLVNSLAPGPNTTPKSSDPMCRKISTIPSNIAASPTRVVMKAFFAALDADGRSYQNPISR